MTDEVPPDGHADELLSAHLDRELDPRTDAWVVQHVEACEPCRLTAEHLAETRSLLRELPPVDGTLVIEGFLARHRRAIRTGAAFVGVAALVLLLAGLTTATAYRSVVPDVEGLAAGHERSAPGQVEPMQRRARATYAAPPGLMGSALSLSRHETWDGTDVAAVVYRDGDLDVSVYQEPGRVDWDGLPPGEIERIGDGDVWFGPGRPVVAVAQRGDLVVTVVSDDRRAVLTAVAGLPDWNRDGTWDRVHDACQRLVRVFALGG